MIKISEIKSAVGWRDKLKHVKTFDFYHTWDFHYISQKNGEGIPILFDISDEGGGILFPALLRKIDNTEYYDITSVYGYPSPLIYGNIKLKFSSLWSEFVKYLYQNKIVSYFSRGSSLIDFEGVEGFLDCQSDIVYIDLMMDEISQVKEIRGNLKRDIKKLKSVGVECFECSRETSLLEFKSIYEKTMCKLNASSYYFFSDEYYDLLFDSKDFEAKLFLCKLDGAVVCAGIFVFCNEFVQYFLGGTHPDFYSLGATKIMIDHVRFVSGQKKFKFLVLGGGLGGKEDGLLNFKKGFSKKRAKYFQAKKIINYKVYAFLSKNCKESSFFPKYRKD